MNVPVNSVTTKRYIYIYIYIYIYVYGVVRSLFVNVPKHCSLTDCHMKICSLIDEAVCPSIFYRHSVFHPVIKLQTVNCSDPVQYVAPSAWKDKITRHAMYCTYNVTMRCVRATIAAVEQQQVL